MTQSDALQPTRSSIFRNAESPRLRRWSEPAQILFFAFSALFINMAVGYLISPFHLTDAEDVMNEVHDEFGVSQGYILVVLAAPFMETAYGQLLPLLFARITKRTRTTQILWAAVWFSILHIPNGPAHMMQTFFVGWVFAVCFLFGWSESFIKAYRTTFLVHALHNFIVFTLFLFVT
ncbi:MAG: CPBP family intramembrane metalloprotease [bacterium]|nr:CPBP family intramembrane metalloprotease [bacterium]